jgi:hypothetical protein
MRLEEHPAEQTLDPNQILIAEYNYIAQTAFQVNEDRARVAVFYLSAVGGILLAILGAQTQALPTPGGSWGFMAVFLVLSLSGFLTLLQLVRLRLAWFESMYALNQIKEFYIQQGQIASLPLAFAWRGLTLPSKFKLATLSFLYAVQIAVLSGLTLGAAIMFAGLALGRWWWGLAVAIGVSYALIQIFVYWLLLRK